MLLIEAPRNNIILSNPYFSKLVRKKNIYLLKTAKQSTQLLQLHNICRAIFISNTS